MTLMTRMTSSTPSTMRVTEQCHAFSLDEITKKVQWFIVRWRFEILTQNSSLVCSLRRKRKNQVHTKGHVDGIQNYYDPGMQLYL